MKLITSKNNDRYKVGALISDDQIVDLTSLISDQDLNRGARCQLASISIRIFWTRPKMSISQPLAQEPLNLPMSDCGIGPEPGQDHLHRPELSRPCRGKRHGDPDKAGHFLKVFKLHHCSRMKSIVVPDESTQTDYEAELAVVIGRRATNVNRRRRNELRVWLRQFQRCQRPRFPVCRRSMAAWQIVRHICTDRPVYCNDGRNTRPAEPLDQVSLERRDDAGFEYRSR